jgi:hypothetical protein
VNRDRRFVAVPVVVFLALAVVAFAIGDWFAGIAAVVLAVACGVLLPALKRSVSKV